MSDTVIITKNEYYNLRIAQEKLCLLEAGGVDNWEGYCDSLNNEYDEMDYSFEEIKNQVFCEIYGAEVCHAQ